MHTQQDPIVNNWYTNLTGQLFKVRMVAYDSIGLSHLVIEYIDGSKHVISKLEWDCLKLMTHSNQRKKEHSEETTQL